MKKLIITLMLCLFYVYAFTQFEKIILQHHNKQPRWVVECDNETDENCRMTVYFRDGEVKAKVKITYHDTRNRFRPNGDAVVYYENGQVHQEYNHATGILLTYYSTGELKEKMITPIQGTVERKIKFYKNGQIWEEEDSKREVGKQNLVFAHNSRGNDYFYDNTGYSYNYYKTYHGNGRLKSHTYIDGDAPHLKYIYEFYKPNGTLDIDATYERLHGRQMKQGRRYQYHPNGQIQQIADYVNDKFEGELKRWTSNGLLLQH